MLSLFPFILEDNMNIFLSNFKNPVLYESDQVADQKYNFKNWFIIDF